MIVPVGAGSANTNIKRPRKISSRPVGSSLAMAVAVRFQRLVDVVAAGIHRVGSRFQE